MIETVTRRSLPLLGAALLAALALIAVFVTLSWRAQDQAEIAEGRLKNCLAIEELKAHERAEAIDNYENLDQTLRLLRLERTPEIERTARNRRDRTLMRFAPAKC